MNPDADTQDLAGIYQLEAAVFVQNADYTFAMMSAASGCDQVALVNLDSPAIGKLERECFERRACCLLLNHVPPNFAVVGLSRSPISRTAKASQPLSRNSRAKAGGS